MPVYLDHAATTPLAPEVLDAMMPFLTEVFGNAGSRTHQFGSDANKAIEAARREVAKVAVCEANEVVFTPGATAASNLALLGLAAHGEATRRRHIISTTIEHKATIEPIEKLRQAGFDVDLCPVGPSGRLDAEEVRTRLRSDTLLVSVMAANNETGIVQPIEEVATLLADHHAYLHVDAAQTFAKHSEPITNPRVDLVSVSAHKIRGPKGIGCLIARTRKWDRPPLEALTAGGGQEQGLWPGTQPVHQIVGFGAAAELAATNADTNRIAAMEVRSAILSRLSAARIDMRVIGDREHALPHILSLSFTGVDAEALMLAAREEIAISNGSACTSSSYEPSHVLIAMGLSEQDSTTVTRWSWGPTTEIEDGVLNRVAAIVASLGK